VSVRCRINLIDLLFDVMGAEVLGNDDAATTRRRRGASRGFTYGRGGPWAFATRARGADWPPRVRSLEKGMSLDLCWEKKE